MDLTKLAALLGLAATATEAEIEAGLSKQLGELPALRKSGTSLATITAALEKEHQLKIDGDKLVKLSAPPPPGEPKEGDSDEVKAMKLQLKGQAEELAAIKRTNALASVNSAKELAESFIKAGKVPPALRESLSRLLSLQGKATSLQLSSDGTAVEQAVDAASEVLTVLKGLPSLTELQLSTGGKPTDEQKAAATAAEKGADAMEARHQPNTQ